LNEYLFTSESVAEGHPDKMADQISDAILDAILLQDPWGKVACECLVKTGVAIVAGEISTHAAVDIEQIVRNTIKEIGYDHSRLGFDGNTCGVLNILGKQSSNIADGIRGHSPATLGAGDQGITFGYACDETPELMPATLVYAHRLMARQAQLRKARRLPFLLPDAKSQVTLRYRDNRVLGVDTVVVSTQHSPDIPLETLREAVIEEIVKPVMPARWITPHTRFLINPAGAFVIGGPVGDCGLTGRKIIVDTYGGAACHGGGAFSGKDPSKVDRSAAYAARYVGLARKILSPPGWRRAAKSSWDGPSASPARFPSGSTPSAPKPCHLRRCSTALTATLISACSASSTCLICWSPAIVKRPAMATLVATAFRGKPRIKRLYYAKRLAVTPLTRSTK